jgi:hypothetical protein
MDDLIQKMNNNMYYTIKSTTGTDYRVKSDATPIKYFSTSFIATSEDNKKYMIKMETDTIGIYEFIKVGDVNTNNIQRLVGGKRTNRNRNRRKRRTRRHRAHTYMAR